MIRLQTTILLLVLGAVIVSSAFADECPRSRELTASSMTAPSSQSQLPMEATMPSGMARPGTKMMDASQAAAEKERCMDAMLKRDEATMDSAKPSAR